MTNTLRQHGHDMASSTDEPEAWAPPSAPLDMPRQDIEPRLRGFDLVQILRLMLPGQRI